jgi:hypothetical protein
MSTVPPIATCPRDGVPLIMTTAWRAYEWYCLECGGHYGFLDVQAVAPTPELNEQYNALEDEWNEHVKGKFIVRNGLRTEGCETCAAHNWNDTHDRHATAEEWAEHERAMEWLHERANQKKTVVSDDTDTVRE